MKNNQDKTVKFQLWGWILFTLCALLYLAASIRHGDILSFLASLVFLAACVLFMIPLVQTILADRNNKPNEIIEGKESD